MRFRLVDAAKKDFPVARLCKVLDVSPSGYFAWKNRPASARQREDLVLLAHVRSAFTLSHETYGSPRMTHELREQGLAAGRRRVARLMRENGLKARQPRRFRRTTDSGHAFPSRAQPPRSGLHGGWAGPEMGRGHLLHLDAGGLAVPGGGPRPVLSTSRGLGGGRPSSQGARADCAATRPRRPAARARFTASFRPRQSVLFERVSGGTTRTWHRDLDVRQGKLLMTTRWSRRSSRR